MGGVYFDDSIRLEPSQVAGFISSFRSLIPESVAGLVSGTAFDTYSVGFDQKLPGGTYAGVAAELLQSDGTRTVGAFSNATIFPVPDSATSTRQSLHFEERTLSVYLSQLIAQDWVAGARYRVSEAKLTGRFPDLAPGTPGLQSLQQDERSVLHHAQLYLLYQNRCGFFAEWNSNWYAQSNRGYTPDRPGDTFWQHDVFVGYRFPRRHAEVRAGILNLTDTDYRLNPLNVLNELPRSRTFVTSLRINF